MGSYTNYYHLYVTDGSDYVDPTTDWSQNFVNIDEVLHLKADDDTVVHLAGNETIIGSKTFNASVILNNGANIVLGSSTGTKVGTSTSQKLGFFGATPVVQIAGSTDVLAGLVTLGFRAASNNPPLDLGTGTLTAGTVTSSNISASTWTSNDASAIVTFVTGTVHGTVFGSNNTTSKVAFFGSTPVVQIGGSTDIVAGMVTLGLRGATTNPPLNIGSGAVTAGSATLAATTVTTLGTAGNITLTDGNNIIVGSASGTQIATATSQKLGFFGASPVIQITGSTDVLAGLVTLGLRAASSNPPLNLGTGALTAGTTTVSGTGSSTALTITPPTTPTGSSSAFIGSVAGGGVTVAFQTTAQTGTYTGWKKSQNTLTNPSSGTIPDAIGTWFAGGPIASTNVTITRNYGTYIGSTVPVSGSGTFGLAISNDFTTQALWISANNDSTTAAAGIAFGLSRDVTVYRSGANAYTVAASNGLTVTGPVFTGSSPATTGQINLPNNTSIAWKGDGATPSDQLAVTFDNANVLQLGAVGANGASIRGVLNMNSRLINNVLDPVSVQDAATKNYVGVATQINSPTFGSSGVVATSTGQSRFYVEDSVTIVAVRASVGTAPTGAALICDVNKNGTTIYSTQGNRPTIAISGSTTTANSPDITTAVSGDYFTVDVDQVGSTIAGSDLTLQIHFKKT